MGFPWSSGNPLNAADLDAVIFGGTGADGALSISSGTTTLDLGGAQIFAKNYSSISITGTGALAFSNPHANGTLIILKSQGNVTITSSAARAIDLRSLGGAAGSAGATYTDGGNGGASTLISDRLTHYGRKGVATTSVGGAACDPWHTFPKFRILQPGAGGGGGAGGQSSNGTGGAGGAGGVGGGSLIIECSGNLSFSGTIDASGANGSAGSGGTNPGGLNHNYAGGGGGGAGGGGGSVVIHVFGTITDTGTITVTGGTGQAGGQTGSGVNGGTSSSSGVAGGGGGGGTSAVNTGTGGTNGGTDTTATTRNIGGNGGNGGDGIGAVVAFEL